MANAESTDVLKKRRRSRWWMAPVVVAGIIIVLILLALAATQTGWFRSWLKGYVVSLVNESIDGTVAVESLGGNLFTSLQLEGVSLRRESDTLLSIPQIDAYYDLAALLHHRIVIDSLTIKQPHAFLKQTNDTLWNFSQLLRVDTTSSSSAFDFVIQLNDVKLNDGSVQIMSPDSLIPKFVDSVQIQLAGEYSANTQKLMLSRLGFVTRSPDLSMHSLSLELTADSGTTTISNLLVVTGANRIMGDATIPNDNPEAAVASLKCDSLTLGEFAQLAPDMNLTAYPPINLTAKLAGDSLALSLGATRDRQNLNAELSINKPFALMSDSTWNQVSYSSQAKFSHIDPGYWLHDASLDYNLSGTFAVVGAGIAPEVMHAKYVIDLEPGRVQGRNVDAVHLDGEYDAGDLSANVKLSSGIGKGSVIAEVRSLLATPDYTISGEVTDLNLGALLGNDSLTSNLNFHLRLAGTGFDPDSLNAGAEVAFARSRLMNFDIDTAYAEVDYRDNFISVDTAEVSMPMARFWLGGGLGLDQTGRLSFELQPHDLKALARYLEIDTLQLSGALRGSIEGSLADFEIKLIPDFHDIRYDEITVDSIYGDVSATVTDTALAEVSGDLFATRPAYGDYQAKALNLHGEKERDAVKVSALLVVSDSTKAKMTTEVAFDSSIYLNQPQLQLTFPDQDWNGGAKRIVIVPATESYVIDSLQLNSPDPQDNTQQLLAADGEISLLGAQNLNLNLNDLSLAGLTDLLQLQHQLQGKLNLRSSLKGTAAAPILAADVSVTDGKISDFVYRHLSGIASYEADSLNLAFDLIASAADTFTIDAYLPLHLSLTDTNEVLSYDRPFHFRARTQRLPLASLNAFMPSIERASGTLALEVSASNTLRDPVATGSLTLQDAALKIPEYGIDYNTISADVALNSNQISINEITAHRGNGVMKLTGHLEYDSTIVTGLIKSTDVRLTANNFYVTRHRDYEIQINANTNLAGPLQAATFGGQVTVLRSSIYLPAFYEEENPTELSGEPPLLVQATRPAPSDSLDSTKIVPVAPDVTSGESSEIYKNLQGHMVIEIPRNTWLRSPELKVEISGKVELVKEGPEPELFGSISVVRGNYDLYGRRFVVDEGTLNFQGGVEMNPIISIKAHYDFRTAGREKKTLALVATGTAEEPQLSFTLDGNQIPEGDAASYLAFGRSLDQLTYGERTQLTDTTSSGSSQASLASGVLASVVSSQISKTLGKELKVDVFDVKAQSDWKAATFVVGKYITNDLFVSYERAVGDIENDDIAQQVVTLEYELTRLIYLQLIEGDAKSSGFDIIFKWFNQKAF